MSYGESSTVEEYAQLASIYDQRWSFYVQATIKATLERLALNPQGQVLDLACGTGTLLNNLLPFVPAENLFGIDVSTEMLTVAREKLPTEVNLSVGSGDHLPFAEASFEQVISTSSFHYFRKPEQVLQEARRVLKPEGHLLITDWCRDYITCWLLDRYLQWFNEAHYHTYSTQELQTLLQQANFRQNSIESYKINWFWGMMTAQAVK